MCSDIVYLFLPKEGENEVTVQLSAIDLQDILNYEDMEAGILNLIIRKLREIQDIKRRCAPSSSKDVPLIQKQKPAPQTLKPKWSAFLMPHTLVRIQTEKSIFMCTPMENDRKKLLMILCFVFGKQNIVERATEPDAKSGALEDFQTDVVDFVMGLEDDIELLFIPLFNLPIKHYTLLTFNFISYDWTHYNSLRQTTYEKCKVDAELMKETLEPIVRRKVDMMRERCPAKMEYESKVLNCSPNCPQQQGPNCLLYTAYYMQRLMTTPFEISEGNDEDTHKLITKKRLVWAKKLLSSQYVTRTKQ